MRQYRKKEHIENYLRCSYQGNTLFDDVFITHDALPGLALEDVDLSIDFLGKKSNYPIFINAMTGGSEFSMTTNEELADIAAHFNIPMAVGSQTIGIEDPDTIESFTIVREKNPEGIIMANLSGNASVEDARKAIDMIDADGLQIHLNVAQELAMKEGDRDFRAIPENIQAIVAGVDIPVIVKEVGFGISKETAQKLYDLGVRYIDVAGHGGSNFIEIENLRNPHVDLSELYCWGIPTAYSLIRAKQLEHEDLQILASGGIRNSLEVLKALAIGADMVGICGELLNYLVHGGYDHGVNYIEHLMTQLKMLMLLSGVDNVKDARNIPYKTSGRLFELLNG